MKTAHDWLRVHAQCSSRDHGTWFDAICATIALSTSTPQSCTIEDPHRLFLSFVFLSLPHHVVVVDTVVSSLHFFSQTALNLGLLAHSVSTSTTSHVVDFTPLHACHHLSVVNSSYHPPPKHWSRLAEHESVASRSFSASLGLQRRTSA